jgi:uncharacterized repeat protein (TIGR01451 family)
MRGTRYEGPRARGRRSRFEVIALLLGLALVVSQAIGIVAAAAGTTFESSGSISTDTTKTSSKDATTTDSAASMGGGSSQVTTTATGGTSRAGTGSNLASSSTALNVDLDQYANVDAAWQNGDLNGNNSAYSEGEVVPFRLAIEGLSPGSHTIHINYDFTAGGHEAYDFLATWNATESPGLCDAGGGGVSSMCPGLGSVDTKAFPSDPFQPGTATGSKTKSGLTVAGAEAFSGVSRDLTMYGGTITSISGPTHAGAVGNNSTGDFLVTFDKVGDDGAVLFSWGGHLAESAYWKDKQDGNNGASTISGAPWHMRTQQLDNSSNKNQDRSIQPSAIVPLPGLEITKTASSSQVSPGDTFTYTITVANTGSATASPVVITDDLNDSLTGVSATYDINPGSGQDGTCTVGAGNSISCPASGTISLAKSDGDEVAPENDVVAVTVTATAPSDSCPTLLNTASAQLGNETPITSDQVTVDVVGCAPVLEITKEASTSQVSPGDSFGYTITVTNTGNADATGVVVTDDLDDTLTVDSAAYDINGGSSSSCDLGAGNMIRCPASGSETLKPGDVLTVTIGVTTDPSVCGALFNQAHAAFNEDAKGVDSDLVEVDVVGCSVDVTVTKDASSTSVNSGDKVAFTITATNNGSVTATGVQVTDSVPAGLTITDATWSNGESSGSCDVSGQNVTCDVGDLGAGGSATVTISVTTTDGACPSVQNTASVSAANEDESAGGNNTSDPVTVNVTCPTTPPPPPPPPASLGIQILKGGPALAHVGDTITYTFDVSLTTSTALTNVAVTDPICSAAPTLDSKGGGDQDDWLEPGETWHYSCTHVVSATDPDPLPNTATAAGTDSKGRNTSDTDDHLVDIIHPAIKIVKTANPTSIAPGETVTYTYKVTNIGDVTLYNVSVDDDKLGHVCDIPQLDVGASQTCTKDFTAGEKNLGPLDNVAVAEGEDETGYSVRDDDKASIDVVLGITVTPTTTPPQGTAFTGSRALPLAAVALIFLVIGSGLMYVGRRRDEGSGA